VTLKRLAHVRHSGGLLKLYLTCGKNTCLRDIEKSI
jgi:hypothetical protein